MLKYYTVQEVAKILKRSVSNVNLWCRKLGVPKVGKTWVITDKELEVFPSEPAPPGPKPKKLGPIDPAKLMLLEPRERRFVLMRQRGMNNNEIAETEGLSRERVRKIIDRAHQKVNSPMAWTAAELRELPPEQRNPILEAAAAVGAEIYRSNPILMDFEAFGDKDLYGESSAAPEM